MEKMRTDEKSVITRMVLDLCSDYGPYCSLQGQDPNPKSQPEE
jgi:hypothetical protein